MSLRKKMKKQGNIPFKLFDIFNNKSRITFLLRKTRRFYDSKYFPVNISSWLFDDNKGA